MLVENDEAKLSECTLCWYKWRFKGTVTLAGCGYTSGAYLLFFFSERFCWLWGVRCVTVNIAWSIWENVTKLDSTVRSNTVWSAQNVLQVTLCSIFIVQLFLVHRCKCTVVCHMTMITCGNVVRCLVVLWYVEIVVVMMCVHVLCVRDA